MRALVAILLFLAGCGAVAYSYIGAMMAFADEVAQTAEGGNEAGVFSMLIDFILAVTIPQLTGFLYAGLFLIAVSIVTLIVRPKSNDR